MRWAPRLNAAPATSTELRNNRTKVAAEDLLLAAEADDAAAIGLADGRSVDAQRRIIEIERERAANTRVLAGLDAAIVEAERREQRADLEKRLELQRRLSTRLGHNLQTRYNRAAETLVAILAEMDADANACAALNAEARDEGIVGITAAELTLRRDVETGSLGYESLARATVWSWSGGSGYPLWPRARQGGMGE